MDFDRKELSEKLVRDFMDEDIGAERRRSARNVKIFVPMIAFAVTCFVAYAWYYDKVAISNNINIDLPVIKADKSPVRIKPENPGGMYIANRDKKVYEAISKNKNLPTVIRLLPNPEEPVEREIVIKAKKTITEMIEKEDLEDLLGRIEEENIEKPKKIAAAKLPAKKVIKKSELLAIDIKTLDDTSIEELTVSDFKIIPKPQKRLDNKRLIKQVNQNLKGFFIQLGSYRTNKDAQSSWSNIKKKHKTTLAKLSSATEKADLGKKGTFYRLQVGPFTQESSARSVCTKLKDKKQGCFIVKK